VDRTYIELKDSQYWPIVLSAGFSENLESGDFLSSLEDILPMKIVMMKIKRS